MPGNQEETFFAMQMIVVFCQIRYSKLLKHLYILSSSEVNGYLKRQVFEDLWRLFCNKLTKYGTYPDIRPGFEDIAPTNWFFVIHL